MVVHGVELALRLPAVYVAAVVAPAGGLGIEGHGNGVIQAVPHLDHRLAAQGPVVGQHLVGPLLVAAGKLTVAQQVVEDTRGEAVAVVLLKHVLVDVLEDDFAVPAQEAEARGGPALVAPPAYGVPVVVIPVGVAAILIDEHIVYEVADVEQRVQLLVVAVVGGTGSRLCHQFPGVEGALGSLDMVAAVLLNLDDVNVALAAAEVVLAILIVHAFGHVVDAPVHAVEEEVDVEGVDAGMAHAALHAAGPDVAGVLSLFAVVLRPVLPGVAEVAAQHQLVELRRLVLAVERIFQRLRAVLLLEDEAERVLGVLLGQSAVTAVQTDAAADAEVVSLGTAYQFHVGCPRPAVPRVVAHRRAGEDVDAAAVGVVLVAEEVVLVRDEAQDGQLLQPLRNLRLQLGVARHLRVHFVVGHSRAPYLGVAAPLGRVARRLVRLAEHGVDKKVRGGGDVRCQRVALHLGRPQDGGLADGQRLGVALARLRGEAAVGGIAYLRCRICSFYADGQLTAVVESVRLAEAGLGHSCRRDEACENEFADLVHFADILGFRLQR